MMTYTKEIPKTEGWYFVRSVRPGSTRVAEVKRLVMSRGKMSMGDFFCDAYADVEYAGPIPEPTDSLAPYKMIMHSKDENGKPVVNLDGVYFSNAQALALRDELNRLL